MRRSLPTALMLTSLMLTALAPTGASAQGCDEEAESALLRQGFERREAGDDAGGLELFERAYAMCRSTRALALMGLAELALRRWRGGHGHLTEALAGDHPWVERHRADLERERIDAAGHLGRLTLAGVPDGATVRVRGETLGTTPLDAPILVEPGSAVVEVEIDGRPLAPRRVTFVAGQTREVTFAPSTASPSTPRESADQGGEDVGPWILLGGAAAVAVAGAVMTAVGALDLQAVEDPPPGAMWMEGFSDQADRGLVLSPVGVVALSVGVVGVGAAILWWALSQGDDGRAGRPGVIVF